MGEEKVRGDATAEPPPTYVVPSFNGANTIKTNSIYDYFGLPAGGFLNDDISCLPFRAYQLIYNEWFRPQDIIDKVPFRTDGAFQDEADFKILKRAKRHDYFTSCQLWPQKGPSVGLPLGVTADIIVDPDHEFPSFSTQNGATDYRLLNENVVTGGGDGPVHGTPGSGQANAGEELLWDNPGLLADLTGATAATINNLREAFQLQRMYERDSRGGSRYTELIRSHYGVTSPDARLQRPEYLGGKSTRIMANIVPNTAAFPSGAPLGELASYMTSGATGDGFMRSFTEHGLVIGLCNVRADLTYQRGVERFWSRKTRFDHYWPTLSHLGEQEVKNKEIWQTGAQGVDDATFGFQERYAEYRYKPSQVTGIMRSVLEDPPESGEPGQPYTSLDTWHLAQDFDVLPQLNEEFIEDNPPIARIVAVPSEPDMLLDAQFSYVCVRPMPVYGVPGMIDHF